MGAPSGKPLQATASWVSFTKVREITYMKGKENAEQKAYRLIIHDIKTKCQPGDFLLERDLAERFGVSRTPVTIALNRLVAEGLLQKLPKKGCFIPNLNYDDARAAFSVRILLECEAARCAAQNAQAEDLHRKRA